jgi:uncharacterized protein (DUF2164 family)
VDAHLAQRAQVRRLIAMTIQLPKDARDQAVASLQRYTDAELDERFGNLASSALLDFFLDEIAPLVYNTGCDQRAGAHADTCL